MNVNSASSAEPVRLRVHYRNPEAVIGEFTRSVSAGNVSLESKKPVPVGTRFMFELHAQGVAEVVEVIGEVVEVTPQPPDRYVLSIRYQGERENRSGLDAMLQRIFDVHRAEKARKHPRIPIHVRATSETPYSPTYLIRDISRGGIGVEVEAPTLPRTLQVGAPFLLELSVSLGALNLYGEVSWVFRGVSGSGGSNPTFGVSFGTLRPDTAQRLEQVLALQKLPPPPWKARLSLGLDAVSRMP